MTDTSGIWLIWSVFKVKKKWTQVVQKSLHFCSYYNATGCETTAVSVSLNTSCADLQAWPLSLTKHETSMDGDTELCSRGRKDRPARCLVQLTGLQVHCVEAGQGQRSSWEGESLNYFSFSKTRGAFIEKVDVYKSLENKAWPRAFKN